MTNCDNFPACVCLCVCVCVCAHAHTRTSMLKKISDFKVVCVCRLYTFILVFFTASTFLQLAQVIRFQLAQHVHVRKTGLKNSNQDTQNDWITSVNLLAVDALF